MALKILVTDDNEMNRWLLAEQLQVFGLEVVQAVNGVEALSRLQANNFACAFLDVNMPLMNGLELIASIRAIKELQTLPCVAVTAHARNGLRQELLGLGFDECLLKPIVLGDLQRIVERFLSLTCSADVESYAGMLLRKVDNNRELAQLLLNKVFKQVPEQCERLQHCLLESRFQEAWSVAHQLHGTFCFVGFEDFRIRASALEQSLVQVVDGGTEADRQLQLLRQMFARLIDQRVAVFGRVD